MEKTSCENVGTTASLLDALYHARTGSGPLSPEETHADFDRLYELLGDSSMESVDKTVSLVCHLCGKFERAGFFEGVKVGYQLSTELHA